MLAKSIFKLGRCGVPSERVEGGLDVLIFEVFRPDIFVGGEAAVKNKGTLCFFFVSRRFASRIHEISDLKKKLSCSVLEPDTRG